MKTRSSMPYDCVAFDTDELAKTFTLAEEGAYHRLLRHAWINGSIPRNTRQLAGICRISELEFLPLWEVLQKSFRPLKHHPDRLVNKKQESERQFLAEKSQKAAASAVIRWQAVAAAKESRNANAMRAHSENDAPSPRLSSSHTPSLVTGIEYNRPSAKETGERTNGKDTDCQKFWAPVEGYLRKQFVEESFQAYFAGCRLLRMSHQEVVLAVPPALIQRNQNAEVTAKRMADEIEKANTNLLRGRALVVVPLSGEMS
jgi:uncharacterized protein YdaU (DUF1376 family)